VLQIHQGHVVVDCEPGKMGRKARDSRARTEEALQSVAEDLSSNSSADATLDRLKALNLALNDALTTDGLAPATMALLLPSVVRLLRGNPTAATVIDPDMRSAISGEAGGVLDRLVLHSSGLPQLASSTSLVSPLMKALRDAPNVVGRIAAARALTMVADTQPAQCRALAKAGGIGLVLAFFDEVGDLSGDREKLGPVWDLAHVLLSSQPFAVRDLRRAICGRETDQNFIALIVLQVGSSTQQSHVFARKAPLHCRPSMCMQAWWSNALCVEHSGI
jgi:hypothetical protein